MSRLKTNISSIIMMWCVYLSGGFHYVFQKYIPTNLFREMRNWRWIISIYKKVLKYRLKDYNKREINISSYPAIIKNKIY